MKSLKKLLSIFAAFMMVVGLTMTNASAAENGSVTITNPDKDATYKLYKIFDATYSGDATAYYVDINKANKLSKDLFTVGTTEVNGQYVVSKKEGVTDAQIISWLKENYSELASTPTATKTGSDIVDNKLTFSQLDYGYYLIVSTLGDDVAITIDSANPSQDVIAKNTNGPTITDQAKTIVDVTGRETTAKIGDTVNFKVEFVARNFSTKTNVDGTTVDTKITQYKVEDLPTGITLNDDFAVTVGSTSLTKGTDFTVENNIVTIPWENNDADKTHKYESPVTVTITYSGVLNEITGSNTAKISYNDTTPTDSQVDVHTVAINLKKVDGATKEVINGAEFELQDSDGNKIAVRDATDEEKASAGLDYVVLDHQDKAETEATIEAGNVTIGGLKENTSYKLKETKAPDGYNILNDAFPVITNSYKTDGAVSDAVVASVENNKGSTLPTTGGMGTTMLYVVGGILMVGAAILFVTNKRMKHN